MIRCIDFLVALSGIRRFAVVLASGVVAALSLPPLDFWPLLFVAFPIAFTLLEGISRGRWLQAFLLGWVFGFGYFLFAFHWIGFAFFVNAKDYLWMMPFAVGGLSAAMAIYWGLAFLAMNAINLRGLPLFLIAPAALTGAEYLRGVLFTGFPWAAPGLASDGMGAISQTASLWGMPGLSLLVMLWASVWICVFNGRLPRGHRIMVAVLMLTMPLCWVWGSQRLKNGDVGKVEGVNVRIVQPNISQDDKWRDENARGIFDQLLEMSAQKSTNGKPITHIVWPELAVPFLIDESDGSRAELAAMLAGEQTLMTGTLRRDKNTAGNPNEDKVYNSVLTFDGFGNVVARYDKWRLVPGGEFLPFEWLLKPLGFRKVVTLPGSFEPGAGPLTFSIPSAPPVGFSICYEAIFPDQLIDAGKRPSWLVNVTNDGWFGNSTGPYQHLAQVRLRAIEQGLPIVRAANTGISAVIDPFGRYLERLPVGQEGIVDATLPQKLDSTGFSRFGQIIVFLMGLFLCILAIGVEYNQR